MKKNDKVAAVSFLAGIAMFIIGGLFMESVETTTNYLSLNDDDDNSEEEEATENTNDIPAVEQTIVGGHSGRFPWEPSYIYASTAEPKEKPVNREKLIKALAKNGVSDFRAQEFLTTAKTQEQVDLATQLLGTTMSEWRILETIKNI